MIPKAGPGPGDSSEIWQQARVSEVGAASVARVMFDSEGSRVRTGFDSQSRTTGI